MQPSPRRANPKRLGAGTLLILAGMFIPATQAWAPYHRGDLRPSNVTPREEHPVRGHHIRLPHARLSRTLLVAGTEVPFPRIPGCDDLYDRTVAIGRWIASQGFSVREHPAFGGVSSVHAYGSAHYIGHAIDVNWQGEGELERLDALNAALAGEPHVKILWRTYGHWDHLHLELDP